MQNKPTLPTLLIAAGYTPRVAKALAWLILRGDSTVTSREIERGADLRQPEVHYAISVLEGMKWIEKIETPSTSKPGRPFTQYRLRLTKDQVYTEIKAGIDKKAGDLAEMTSQIHDAIFDQGQPAPVSPAPEIT
jgi:predicted transcriptional regulator